ncbi:Polyadenylation and cleavage factor-like protein [Cardamine amara subsp. amara]|uniref:Polyadenylation and cleavage factor-like protein n=1 Tax=Cardamine amara subsp. amara TaxID=228776 RepID=A0ABD1BA73_CARAN
MSSNGFFSSQRNSQHRNANAGTTMKRRNDNRGYNGIGGFQEERSRYAPPQKRLRSQTQTQTQPQTQFRSGMNLPLYHHHHHGISNNMSRVSESYNNYGDVITSNSSFDLPNNDSYRNPNPQIVPIPLPYRKLDSSFDSLPEWAPNQTLNPNFTPNANAQAPPAFTNVPNPLPLNHSNMVSIVSQAMMTQPIVLGKELTDLLSVLNNEKEKETSEACNSFKLPPGLSFDDPSSLKVRHETVIKSLYSDMPRQCSSCGVRFKSQEEHSNHMDWHVRKNRSSKSTTKQSQKPKKSRDWFASTPLWLIAATGGTVESAKASFGVAQMEEHQAEEHVVPADEDQKLCALCEESFEDFFSHEADDWMYKDAVYLTKNGPIVHVKCMPETRVVKPRAMSVSVPSVASAIVC